MQFMSNQLHYDARLELRSFPTCRQCQSCLLTFASNWLRRNSSNRPINSEPTFNAFAIRQPCITHHFLLRFCFFSMNMDAKEFFASNETGTRSTTIDEEDHLFTSLKTSYQLATARSILHEWNRASTLLALTREWSSRHENQPSERSSFSLLLYNISSLRLHLEDLIDYVSESYPSIWALTGLHFNDEVNYQLASYFKTRYTIYYQHGSNDFGGVCLAIAREVPHRITSEFKDINNIIAADVFNLNKKYTVAVVYSPPSEGMVRVPRNLDSAFFQCPILESFLSFPVNFLFIFSFDRSFAH